MKFCVIEFLCLIGLTSHTFAADQSWFGAMCTGPDGSKDSCDHSKTFLYCYEGRCKCPDSLTMTSANLPSNLYSKWNSDANKCLAIAGASCGVQPGGNRMECHEGFKCKITDGSKIGSCIAGGSYVQISVFAVLIALCASLRSVFI